MSHEIHSANHLVNHTSVGKQASAAVVGGVVAAAKVVGAGALASAAAPIVVPVALAAGLAYLASKSTKKH